MLAAVLIGTGFLYYRSSSADPSQAGPTCRLTTPGSAGAGDTVPTGAQVVETGYSKVGPVVSMGSMIRNETGKVAYRTLVTFEAVDSAGRAVVDPDTRDWLTQVVPVLRPGDTAAVGTSALIGRNADQSLKTIDSIKVTLTVDRWLDPGDGNTGLGPVTAAVIVGSGQRNDDAGGSLRFASESANCASVRNNVRTGMTSRGVSLVFRDESGRIVGGNLDTGRQDESCLPGRQENRLLTVYQPAIPPWADLDRTSISVYCDFDRPPASKVPGTPIN
ncbi:hypothetical protein [Actinoplanes sp. G11-F43]|uniref:hypothetical protein n=1 Tax=Actinoplanes sp. G11-F43 TaxID=3424130 RepID=UPI003D32B968